MRAVNEGIKKDNHPLCPHHARHCLSSTTIKALGTTTHSIKIGTSEIKLCICFEF